MATQSAFERTLPTSPTENGTRQLEAFYSSYWRKSEIYVRMGNLNDDTPSNGHVVRLTAAEARELSQALAELADYIANVEGMET